MSGSRVLEKEESWCQASAESMFGVTQAEQGAPVPWGQGDGLRDQD